MDVGGHVIGVHFKGEHHHSSSYSCVTHLARINFPRFSGDMVHQWAFQCKNYFLINNTPDDVHVKLAIVHMEGRALQWHIT